MDPSQNPSKKINGFGEVFKYLSYNTILNKSFDAILENIQLKLSVSYKNTFGFAIKK